MKFKKFSKKAISLLLATVLICSCATVSLSSFAATSTFNVTKNSPAVPLYVGKAVRTGNLLVDIGYSSKPGNTLTWTPISGTSASYDDGGYLVGNSVGITGFKVSDGSETRNVWVIVNGAGDDEFNLVDLDFSYGVDTSDWIEGTADSANTIGTSPAARYTHQPATGDRHREETGYMTGIYSKTTGIVSEKTVSVAGKGRKTALYIPAATEHGEVKAALYNAPMLDDFYDYNIEANMSNKMTTSDPENLIAAPGLFARASINYDAKAGDSVFTKNKSMSLRFRNYGGLSYFAISNLDRIDEKDPWENIPLYSKATFTYYTSGTKADYFMCSDKSKVFYPDAKNASILTNKNVKIELSGSGLKYTLNGNTIFDTVSSASNKYKAFSIQLGSATSPVAASNLAAGEVTSTPDYQNMYNQNIKVTKGGTVGIVNNFGNDLYVYDLKVTPKNILEQKDSFPEMLTVTGDYTMEVNTRVALKNIGVISADVFNEYYQIVNGVLQVFKIPTGNDGKIDFGAVTIKIVPQGSESTINSEKFADSQMVLSPHNTNTYDLRVSGTEIVPGSLKITESSTRILYGNEEANGTSYIFAVADPTDFVVSAEYTTKAENLNNLAVMGASIRLPDGQNKSEAIRFLTRVPAIKNSNLYSDATVTYKAVGTLMMPKSLLGANKLQIPSALVNTFDPTTAETVKIGDYDAKNVVFENLSKTTATFSDAWTSMYYGEQTELDVLKEDMVAVSYVWYEKGGTNRFSYSDEIIKSYDQVYDDAFPLNNNDATLDDAIPKKNMYTWLDNTFFTGEINGAYTFKQGNIKNSSGYTESSGGVVIMTNAFDMVMNGTKSGLYFEGILYNSMTGQPVTYNSGKIATVIINEDDRHEAPAASVGSAINQTIIDDNPIAPIDPSEEEEGEHTVWNLDNTYYKLKHDRKLKIAYVGGSVTYGTGSPNDCWRTKTTAWLKSTYGGVISEIRCYIGGVSSVWNGPRYERDALSQSPDLVFLECSVNDYLVGKNKSNGGYPGKEESALIMDTMIRRTKQLLPNTDIIVVTVDNHESIQDGNINGQGHKAVAEYEKVPYLNVKESLLAVVGQDLSKWSQYITDDVHPNEKGYQVYADYITGEMAKMFAESEKRNPSGLVPHTVAAKPYHPLVPKYFEIIDVTDIQKSAYEGTGWEFSKMPSATHYSEYMIKAMRTGAKFEYSFTNATTLIMPGVYVKGCKLKITLDGNESKTIGTISDAGQAFLFRDMDPNKTHTITMEATGDVANIRCEINCIILGRMS